MLDKQANPVLILSQRVLGSLALGNISIRSHPLAHTSIRRDNRNCVNVKIAIVSFASSDARLVLVRMPVTHRLLPESSAPLAVVGMDSLQPTKVAQLLFVLPGKFLPRRGNEEPFTLCIRSPHHLRAGHHQRPVARLALAQRLL